MKHRDRSTHALVEEQDHLGLERLIFFSDAVFAIAITLLALEIRLPSGLEVRSDDELLAALLGIWPRYMSYVISFLVIGMYWMSHHRMFRSIARYDRRLLFLNLLLLLCIAFVPFPTAMLGEYGGPVPTIFYALTMVVTGVFSGLLWLYASGNGGRLLAAPLTRVGARASRVRLLFAPLVFLISIGIALWDDNAAKLSWIVIAGLTLMRSDRADR